MPSSGPWIVPTRSKLNVAALLMSGISTTNQSGDSQPAPTNYRRVTAAMLFLLACYLAAAGIVSQVILRSIDYGTFVQPRQVPEIHRSMWYHCMAAIIVGLCALMVLRRVRCSLRWPRAAVAASTMLLVVSLDLIVGTIFPPPSHLESILAPHPARGWSFRKGVVGSNSGLIVNINSLGFRGPEISRKKAADEFRILFLGDSVTFGFSLPWEDTFVAKTARKLRDRRPELKTTVINAGVGGYSTWQELDLLENEGIKLEPDLVVLNYCLNDMVDLIYFEEGKIVGNPIQFGFPNSFHWSGIVRAARSTYVRRKDRATRDHLVWACQNPFDGPDPELRSMADLFRDPLLEPVAAAWELSLGHLEVIRDRCADEKLPWILMYCPLLKQLGTDAVYRRPEKPLRRWARERRITYLDLVNAFEVEMARSNCGANALLMDTIHPTAKGSDVITDEIVRTIEAMRVLPGAATQAE